LKINLLSANYAKYFLRAMIHGAYINEIKYKIKNPATQRLVWTGTNVIFCRRDIKKGLPENQIFTTVPGYISGKLNPFIVLLPEGWQAYLVAEELLAPIQEISFVPQSEYS
jgi:hypothetical protein